LLVFVTPILSEQLFRAFTPVSVAAHRQVCQGPRWGGRGRVEGLDTGVKATG